MPVQSTVLLDLRRSATRTVFPRSQSPPAGNKSRRVSCEPKAEGWTYRVAERTSWRARSPLRRDQESRLPTKSLGNRRVPVQPDSVLIPQRGPDLCAVRRPWAAWRERQAQPTLPTLPRLVRFSGIRARNYLMNQLHADRPFLLPSGPLPIADRPSIFRRSSLLLVVHTL